MKKFILDNTLNFITKYKKYSDEELIDLKYGLEGIYLTFSKLILILVLAFSLKIFKEVLSLMIFYNFIRFTGFGFHAKKSWECLITSIIFFIFLPFILIHLNITKFTIILISFLSITGFLLYAPADTPKRPLKNKKKRNIRKACTVTIGIVYFILSMIHMNQWISNILLSSLIIESISINPLFYKLFNQTYNNYKIINND